MSNQRLRGLGWVALLVLLALACHLPNATSSGSPTVGPPATLSSSIGGKPTPPPPPAEATPLPTEMPTKAPPQAAGSCPQSDAVQMGNVGICRDAAVASGITATSLPPGEEEVLFGDMWAMPERVRFDLVGYPLGVSNGQATIIVYEADGLAAASPSAAEILDQIRSILDTKPAPSTIDSIPILPPVNAAQVYRARVGYLEEGNARGIHFLTQYAQDVTPVVNEALTYVYEGFIGDGSQFVFAWLPVSHPTLRDHWSDYTQEELAPLYDDYDSYLYEALANLEMQPAASFTPPLDRLDAMMASIQEMGD